MNPLLLLLLACLGGCATHRLPGKKAPPPVAGRAALPDCGNRLRTPDLVKAYRVARTSDSPGEMQGAHTLYRLEESARWKTGGSDPDIEGDARGIAAVYGPVLQEQNAALKKRLQELEGEAGKAPALRHEVDDLRRKLEAKSPPIPPEEEGPTNIPSTTPHDP